ncbi:MAG: hypothetical protein RLZZ491_2771 [Pseudomonadota bacterium]
MTIQHPVWDPFIRMFHWSLAAGFVANAWVTDPEATLHEQIGYAILALIMLRVIWGLIGPRHARFRDFRPTAAGILAQMQDVATGRRRVHLGHTPLGAVMIFNLLGSLVLIGATGWLMTTNSFWGVEWVEETHEALVLWAELSVVAHIAAVVWESRRTGVNLPRAMVSGVKSVPEDATVVT